MDDLAIAQRPGVAAAAAAVEEAQKELKDWKINNPRYTGEEPAFKTKQPAMNEARAHRLRLTSTEGAPFADVDSTEPASKKPRIGVHLVSDLTAKFEAFRTAELVDGCIVSLSHALLPYLLDKVEKLFVRKCYEDVFALLMNKIEINARECFGPGVVATPSASTSTASSSLPASLSRSFKPIRVLYHAGSSYICYDLETYSVARKSKFDADEIVREPGTFYIIDGCYSQPALSSSCVTLFIGSPQSDHYKHFVKQRKAFEWYFPTWALDELKSCRNSCYVNLPMSTLLERYRTYGGVARSIFYPDHLDDMEAALTDVETVKGVRDIGNLTKMFQTSDTLLHIITSDDDQYQFKCVDIASEYVGGETFS
ncbi:hypothetical protein HDU77_008236 [Chytriomyces hyalinus]|nr:hypothetical protein HDU77_008236 [Chytriomyces hyalinus]